jgi:hypothetical protein
LPRDRPDSAGDRLELRATATWADRIVEYVGRGDEQTGELAKYLDQLARKGIGARRLLDLAAARKPLR